MVIDNTTKTRALFEINKGTNKNPAMDVNAKIAPEDRRIPFQNMIYIADGPSDIPSFSVVKGHGGKAYGVYNPDRPDEFAQNDRLQHAGSHRPLRPGGLSRRQRRPAAGCGCRSRRFATGSSPIARRRSPSALPARRGISIPTPEEEEARRQGRLPSQATFLE